MHVLLVKCNSNKVNNNKIKGMFQASLSQACHFVYRKIQYVCFVLVSPTKKQGTRLFVMTFISAFFIKNDLVLTDFKAKI